jgi:hypothetical protein
MGPARYWDDPDADLERTVDLTVPPAVRARFEPTPGEDAPLDELAHAIIMIGLLLVILGMVALIGFASHAPSPLRLAIVVTGLFTLPGALYVVASIGLTWRQFWAWVLTVVVTLLLLGTLLCTAVYLASTGEPESLFMLLPTAFYFLIPCVILHYAMRALSVIREARMLDRLGFDVLPANDDAAEDQPPPRAVSLDDSDPGEPTSPSPAPPAPSRPPPPPRS